MRLRSRLLAVTAAVTACAFGGAPGAAAQILTDADLKVLYEGCLFTLFPSFYEGWGLPVTESLAFGKPCIASNRSSIPEAGGKLARYIDPNNLTNHALFKYFWTSADQGLSHRGLDEVTAEGAEQLAKYALDHELDGTKSAPGTEKIDDDEKSLMKAILTDKKAIADLEEQARRAAVPPGWLR